MITYLFTKHVIDGIKNTFRFGFGIMMFPFKMFKLFR